MKTTVRDVLYACQSTYPDTSLLLLRKQQNTTDGMKPIIAYLNYEKSTTVDDCRGISITVNEQAIIAQQNEVWGNGQCLN